MKLDRGELLAKLDNLKAALKVGGTVPALGHFWFDGKYVYAYDGGLGMRSALSTEFSLGVPSTQLLGLLKSSTVKEVEIAESEGAVTLKLGKARMRVVALDLEKRIWDFPDKLPKEAYQVELTEEFLEGLRKVAVVKPSHPQRVEHHGVVVVPSDKGKGYDFYTTDSKTMARCSVKAKEPYDENLILPRPFVDQILRQCEAGGKLYILEDCLIADGADVRLYSNVLDASGLIDLGKMVKQIITGKEECIELPGGLSATLDRALVLAGPEEAFVVLSTEADKLRVEGDFKAGDLTEVLAVKAKDKGTVKVQADQIKRGLAEAEEFSITSRALALYGGEAWLYLIAAHGA